MAMITHVFTAKGDSENIDEVIVKLCELNTTDEFKLKKALGSIGGAVNSGFLVMNNGVLTRVR